ncbi:hypothetical protein [Streptomyces sp. NPDC002133]|uniref:MmyB family transcriptional regulator n=1 Tax=Streptomyces sp. NPDC002133 TaxID=3154409 RepID=UPI0033207FA7
MRGMPVGPSQLGGADEADVGPAPVRRCRRNRGPGRHRGRRSWTAARRIVRPAWPPCAPWAALTLMPGPDPPGRRTAHEEQGLRPPAGTTTSRAGACGRKTFRHPDVDGLTLDYQSMPPEDTPGHRVITYCAESGSPEHDALVRLDIAAHEHPTAQTASPPPPPR